MNEQQLGAMPEHSGKRVRVLCFDARTGWYEAALESGTELSLKAAWRGPSARGQGARAP